MAYPPVKLAIIGAGPSAFYTASRLLSLVPQSNPNRLSIDMYDRLWAPHGLVRYGVAPDHPEVKNCTHKFSQAASDPRLRFFGNVNIGFTSPPSSPLTTNTQPPGAISLPLASLLPHYTHLLFATGSPVPNAHPGLPSSSPHVLPALSLVHWYTSHPSAPPTPPLSTSSHVTIIGHGNVALDIARLLLSDPARLAQYDLREDVLDVLRASAVRHVSIVGRRGPGEMRFGAKEVREMMALDGVAFRGVDTALAANTDISRMERQQKRVWDLLRKGSQAAYGSTPRSWSVDFFRSPLRLAPAPVVPHSSDLERVGSSPTTLLLEHTTLSPAGAAVPTGETSALPTHLVVPSLGAHSESSAPWLDARTGHLRAARGRVLDDAGRRVAGVYASGWAAHGARGVLATTMMDAYAVAEVILREGLGGAPGEETGTGEEEGEGGEAVHVLPSADEVRPGRPAEVERAYDAGEVVDYADWRVVDKLEQERGATLGKERERMKWEEARTVVLKARRDAA